LILVQIMDDNKTIKSQMVSGSIWVFGANMISRAISFLATLILARLLMPEAFGIIGYGFLIVNAISMIREMGFNSALIYQKNDIEGAASLALVLIFLWSLFLYLFVFCLAPIAAHFFREPRLTLLLRILTISLVMNSLSSIPMALLSREINFKKRVIPELLNLTVYGIVTVLFALLGLNYWAFVIGVLAADIVQLLAALILRPVTIHTKPNFKIFKELFGFGKSVIGLNILNFSIRNIDDFFVGRMLGTVSLGVYNFSYRIANIPATNITNVLGKVLFPGFTKIAGDTERLRTGFLRAFKYISYLTVPVTFYLILLTPEVINHFLRHWVSAILPIQLIAYYGGLRSLGSGTGSVFFAKGKPHRLLPISLVQVIFLTLFLYPTIHYFGLTGVCILVNIDMTIAFVWSIIRLKKLIQMSLTVFFNTLRLPLIVSGVGYALLMYLGDVIKIDWAYYSLVLKGLGFPLIYLLATYTLSTTPGEMFCDLFKPGE